MKVVAFSDIHNRYESLVVPYGDLLVLAGDATNLGKEEEIWAFLYWFSKHPHKYKIFVPGNHDFDCQKNPNKYKQYCNHNKISVVSEGYLYIEDKIIYCTSWTPYFYDWAFNGTDSLDTTDTSRGPNLYSKLKDLTYPIDLFVSHGPPLGILDKNREGQECGSNVLRHILCPGIKNLICGHIHEGYGHIKKEDTNFYNVSILNRNYILTNPCTIFEI